jgi:hypothetical protein
MRFLFMLTLLTMLTGCGNYILVPKLDVPEELLVECKSSLVEIPKGTTDARAILDNVAANTIIYKECADRQKRSVAAIKKLTGKE